jgi:hypothetical protein
VQVHGGFQLLNTRSIGGAGVNDTDVPEEHR